MKLLVVSDIHNDVENLLKFMDQLGELEFDAIVCPGDLTDYNLPKGFDVRDIACLIVEELKSLGRPVLITPGNMDGAIVPYLESVGVSLHGKGVVLGEVGFYGYGGAKTPFNTPLEPEESELGLGLEVGWRAVQHARLKVQITHVPPARTKLDCLPSGAHVGSEAVRQFIEQHRPQLAVCAHIHEARGVDELMGVKLLNSGRLPEGHYALVNLELDRVEVELRSLV